MLTLLSIGPVDRNFSDIIMKIQNVSSQIIHLENDSPPLRASMLSHMILTH